jgi:hypothetical protein
MEHFQKVILQLSEDILAGKELFFKLLKFGEKKLKLPIFLWLPCT